VRPLDPRLLHHARASRAYVALTAALGVVTAALVVAQALLLARVIAGVAMDGESFADVRTPLLWLTGVVAGRAVVAAAQERFGHRAATAVIGQLRELVVRHVTTVDRSALDGSDDTGSPASLATLTTRGLDALDGYLTRYLPQLVLASTVTPGVLAVIWWHDLVAGLTITLTLPLVPLFMALVGLATAGLAQRRLLTMQRLGAQVLDLVAGLATLRALGRDRSQAIRVREVGDAYRRATMGTLRSAFLSALVLESLTTLSVALVAVGIGLRLVYGHLDLQTGLAVLVLAPEVYLPLRMVGVHYHASVDGLAAAAQVFSVLERPRAEGSSRARVPAQDLVAAPDLRTAVLRLEGVGVAHPGRDRLTPAGLDLALSAGEVVALVGRSGIGKSTAVEVLLGLRRPDRGRVSLTCGDQTVDLADVDPATWFAQLAWVPQRPLLVPGTLRENVLLHLPQPDQPGATDLAGEERLQQAAVDAGLDQVVRALPDGWQTQIGQAGVGLSAGQRQRVALARALVRDAALVVLDEPTAHLDAETEQAVHRTIERLRERGAAVLVVAHRPALVALADRTVSVQDGPLGDPRDLGAPVDPSAQIDQRDQRDQRDRLAGAR
jgi:ATP-binding cassette subfamily C protein CydD